MERTARCLCGGFRVIATGEPNAVGICHCTECQRRTGVPVTYNAYFKASQVRLEGEHKLYTRDGQEGRKVYHRFCPTCGTTVCWTADRLIDTYGIALGAFETPNLPPPAFSIWEASKHPHVAVPDGVQHFPTQRPVPPRG